MNLNDIIQIYINLLIIQYNNKPKAREMIGLIVSTIYNNGHFLADNVFQLILEAISYNTAIGNQLTRIALEEGISRYSNGTYISDEDLRLLVSFRIISNNIDMTEYNIDNLLYQFFGTDIIYQWNQNMTLFVYASYPNSVLQLAIAQKLLPIPTNVGFTLFLSILDIVFVDTTQLDINIEPYDNYSKLSFSLVETH